MELNGVRRREEQRNTCGLVLRSGAPFDLACGLVSLFFGQTFANNLFLVYFPCIDNSLSG